MSPYAMSSSGRSRTRVLTRGTSFLVVFEVRLLFETGLFKVTPFFGKNLLPKFVVTDLAWFLITVAMRFSKLYLCVCRMCAGCGYVLCVRSGCTQITLACLEEQQVVPPRCKLLMRDRIPELGMPKQV